MTIEKEFNKWFENEGLVDFKIDVSKAPEGTTMNDVKAEFLRLEKMIAKGMTVPFPPEQTTKCSPAADYIICSCIAETEIDDAHLAYLLKCEREGKCKEWSDY